VEHFARRSYVQTDELYVHAVRDTGGRLVAVAPLMKTHQPGYGPLKFSKIQFLDADPSLTEIRGLVCPAERRLTS
jgi:hypothetical protein